MRPPWSHVPIKRSTWTHRVSCRIDTHVGIRYESRIYVNPFAEMEVSDVDVANHVDRSGQAVQLQSRHNQV